MTMRALMLLSILLCSAPTRAYEIGTHAYVSKLAVDGSVLSASNPRSIVPVLGFERLDALKPFEIALVPSGFLRQRYFDNLPLPAFAIFSDTPADRSLRNPPCALS